MERHKDYLLSDDIDKIMNLKEKAAFREWIGGQTRPIPEVNGKPTCAYYPWDVTRFLEEYRDEVSAHFD